MEHPMATLVALVTIETDDPVLVTPDIRQRAAVRAAVVAALPNLVRVIALMPEPEAWLMVNAHLIASQQANATEIDYVATARKKAALH
jgi:hypothetical protein